MTEGLIGVTAATGQLGGLVVASLLESGVAAERIVATTRDTARAASLAARGVTVREADYSRPDTLEAAFEGVGRLLLVSGTDVGQRVAQHENVVRAAERAGVRLLAYTSVVNADTTTLPLAAEHQATEQLMKSSNVPYAMLRNGWYFENYTMTIAQSLQTGVILGTAGDGRFTPATRADYAAAAAAVLAAEGGENTAYELGSDTPITMSDLAAEVARQSGREVVYRDMPEEVYVSTLTGFGVPEPMANMLATADVAIRKGELLTESGDMRSLIGRPTATLAEAVATALAVNG